MTSWELAAKSINLGTFIRHVQWPSDQFIYYCPARKKWMDQRSNSFDPSFVDIDGWCEYLEPKKEPEYLYEYMYFYSKTEWYISHVPSRLTRIKHSYPEGKFKLLRKFDPDTLEEIIEDQNAKD